MGLPRSLLRIVPFGEVAWFKRKIASTHNHLPQIVEAVANMTRRRSIRRVAFTLEISKAMELVKHGDEEASVGWAHSHRSRAIR